MTIIIDKNNSKNILNILSKKLKNEPKKGNLAKHFGKLKRNIDGLKYQLELRENENNIL
jgi:hypothetical protein